MRKTRFALIADAHVGPEKIYEGQIRKLSRYSLDYLDQIASEMESAIQPEFVVQLGDLIEDAEEKKEDTANYRAALERLSRLKMPVLDVVGNHEQINFEAAELCRLANRERLYYSLDLGAMHCVVLFSSSVQHTDIHIDRVQQGWLAADLAATEKPTVIFLHHPLDEQNLAGNVWFEKYPDYCFVEERAAVREIIAASGKVQAVFNGHVHRNNLSHIDGIPYITVQSLVEKVGEPDVSSRAYALVDIEGDRLTVDIKGRDAARYETRIKPVRSLSLPEK